MCIAVYILDSNKDILDEPYSFHLVLLQNYQTDL